MSAAKNGPGAVRVVSRVPRKPLRHDEDGTFAIDLWVRRDGAFDSDVALYLSAAEAETLHAQLCYALDDETATLITPADLLPDCRKGVRTARRR
ncbi:hypothetical protein [Streptomyces paromomycinus]|uniref:Uncharacterized protein n=1 Tax=Streptomyces paromomycinus TaxID=92743 RepID=A0A401W5R8_STREY|nr:hypothetical protein [Streptomyces paromomycinus]GCD44658.1 hypothetical protein GKJPGBOP_04359 [Streptomyces paromomycinus]